MEIRDWIEAIAVLGALLLCTKPLGSYLSQVLDPRGKTPFDRLLAPLERGIYRALKVDPLQEQKWGGYLIDLLAFSLVSALFTALLLALQGYLPLNPEGRGALSWHLNVNTTVSFLTNTNWESYSGEKSLSYLSQMAALTVQNFTSAAVGVAGGAVLVRGLARREEKGEIGNFFVDLTRTVLYLLLPLSMVGACLLLFEGVPQNFSPYLRAVGIEGGAQQIAQGPVASQEAIKLLGSNGGGFFSANAAHPYENPTPLSNFYQMVFILLIPAGQIYYFGKAVNNTRHAWCIFAALSAVFLIGVWICTASERAGNPTWESIGVAGANWEGKEVRFGIFGSSLYTALTTAASCGSTNCSYDALTPIGGLVPMLNIQLSETIFGGVGSGLYSVLLFVFLAIFISGLVVGRTPEYLGKKIEADEVKLTVLSILPYVVIVHLFTAVACYTDWGRAAISNGGPHGYSEILYAFSSCGANNGSAFEGLQTQESVGYNVTLALTMLLGRFCVIAPVIALGGSLAKKKVHPPSLATFPISSPVFITLLVGVIILLGALTFLPAFTMGPVLEHFFLVAKRLFP
jgi:K+-transporting ATPase ATPase A chain